MTAAAVSRLIDQARADGLELTPNGDKLKLRGPAEVIERWKPRLAEQKAGILAALTQPIPPDLAALIQRAASFYGYGPGDMTVIQQAAQRDPAGLRLALEADPLHQFMTGRTLDGMMGIDQGHPAPGDAAAGPCAGRGGLRR